MFWKRPTEAELAAEGNQHYKPSDFPEPKVEVWNELWEPLQLFAMYSTQWRMGPGGPIGLDLIVFQDELRRRGITDGDEYEHYMECLQIIARFALAEMNKK